MITRIIFHELKGMTLGEEGEMRDSIARLISRARLRGVTCEFIYSHPSRCNGSSVQKPYVEIRASSLEKAWIVKEVILKSDLPYNGDDIDLSLKFI